jgi:inorganic pyrophosphatase
MTSLQQLLKNARTRPLFVKLEDRPLKYMFGTRNYGEIIGTINKADGDPWDVIVPGYTQKLPRNAELLITRIQGIIYLQNGNHKLIVDVRTNIKKNNKLQLKEIINYRNRYEDIVKLRGTIIYF